MKKVFRTIAAVAILFYGSSGMAKEFKKEPKLEIDGTSKSIVFEWNAHLIETSIKIFDKKGNVFYNDYVGDVRTYTRKFDLTPLADGQYFLKAENSLKEILFSITVNKDDIVILDKEETHKPAFKNDKDLVHMSFLNLSQEEVTVSVVDSSGNFIFEETIVDSYLVGKTFNFEKAFEDNYTIIVENDRKVFHETIAIK